MLNLYRRQRSSDGPKLDQIEQNSIEKMEGQLRSKKQVSESNIQSISKLLSLSEPLDSEQIQK